MNPLIGPRLRTLVGLLLVGAPVLASVCGSPTASAAHPSAPAGMLHALPASNPKAPFASAVDPRLDQKVWIHVTNERIADLLASLSRATAVTLVPRMEVAEERVSLWADGIPLKEAMRDLRHLHGYYWSRARRQGAWAYSLWQDAQSRAREEAEIQRLALEQRRAFQQNVWKHVQALNASDAELKRWGEQDPYLLAQMLHPVVRAGYQLFASLSPDQQARLLQGQTPGRGLPAGQALLVFPLQNLVPPSSLGRGTAINAFPPSPLIAMTRPRGDTVTLGWDDMNAAQRAAVAAMLQGAQVLEERESRRSNPSPYGNPYESMIRTLKSAEPESATVSLFHTGEPGQEVLSARVGFRSGGRQWALMSNMADWADADRSYSDMIRKGEFRLWAGAEADLRPYQAAIQKGAAQATQSPASSSLKHHTDPALETPVVFRWALPVRGGRPFLRTDELLAALHAVVRRPLIMDSGYPVLKLPRGAPPVFRWQGHPARDLLRRLFSGWECTSSAGAIFARNPERLRGRLNELPPAVKEFLDGLRQQPQSFTLDDLALLARTLSPWQILKLEMYLPPEAIDQMLAVDELLKLYGELAPAQRAALVEGLSFASLTPPQQALLLQFAGRQRPYLEPWHLQHSFVKLVTALAPPMPPWLGSMQRTTTRLLFQVRFQDDDSGSFPVDLVTQRADSGWSASPSRWVGKPFPFSPSNPAPEMNAQINPGWKPPLATSPLRGRVAVIFLSRPFAAPYASTRPAPSPASSARALAARLRGTGVSVVQLTVRPTRTSDPTSGDHQVGPPLPNLLELADPGDTNGEPFDSVGCGARLEQSPTVFVVGRDEIVHAVFEGQSAGSIPAIEAAARRAAGGSSP